MTPSFPAKPPVYRRTPVYVRPHGQRFKCKFNHHEKQVTCILNANKLRETMNDDSYQVFMQGGAVLPPMHPEQEKRL